MDLALNNLQGLICHKPNKQNPTRPKNEQKMNGIDKWRITTKNSIKMSVTKKKKNINEKRRKTKKKHMSK